MSTHIPIAILSLAMAIYFGVQLRNTSKQSEIMRWQIGNLDKQKESLKTARDKQIESLSAAQAKFADALTKSEDTVKQADQIQGQYVSLFTDLLELSKDDKDAKEVVDKWGIKNNEPPKTNAAPAAEEKK